MAYSAAFEDALSEVFGIDAGHNGTDCDCIDEGIADRELTKTIAPCHGYTGPVSQIPEPVAKNIYKDVFWDPLRCEEIAAVHVRLSWDIFETGISVGTRRAARFLQRCLNSLNPKGRYYSAIDEDGIIDANTIGALQTYVRTREEPTERDVILHTLRTVRRNALREASQFPGLDHVNGDV